MYYSFPEQNINEDLNNKENQDRRESSDHHHHHHHTDHYTDHCMEMPYMMEPMHTCPYMHMCHMMQHPMMQMPMGYEMKTDKTSCSDDEMSRQYHERPYHHHYHPYHPYHPYYPYFPYYPHYPQYYHHGYTQRPHHYMGRDDEQQAE